MSIPCQKPGMAMNRIAGGSRGRSEPAGRGICASVIARGSARLARRAPHRAPASALSQPDLVPADHVVDAEVRQGMLSPYLVVLRVVDLLVGDRDERGV